MMKAFFSRHSYRGKYLSDPVPRKHLKMILEAGLAAPSGCNKQTTSLIAVDDPHLLARLHAVITRLSKSRLRNAHGIMDLKNKWNNQ